MNICRFIVQSTQNWLTMRPLPSRGLLQPIVANQSVITAGLKQVAYPKRRCRYCYLVIEDEQTWVFCDKFPRHKQVTRKTKRQARNEMIMTAATQGSTKGNCGRGRMHMWTQKGHELDF